MKNARSFMQSQPVKLLTNITIVSLTAILSCILLANTNDFHSKALSLAAPAIGMVSVMAYILGLSILNRRTKRESMARAVAKETAGQTIGERYGETESSRVFHKLEADGQFEGLTLDEQARLLSLQLSLEKSWKKLGDERALAER